MTFRPGDTVRILPDGLPMTIMDVGEFTADVSWRCGWTTYRGRFELWRLALADDTRFSRRGVSRQTVARVMKRSG